jgi:hypothetical protein
VHVQNVTQAAVPMLAAHRGQACFGANRAIREARGAAGCPAPEQRILVRRQG